MHRDGSVLPDNDALRHPEWLLARPGHPAGARLARHPAALRRAHPRLLYHRHCAGERARARLVLRHVMRLTIIVCEVRKKSRVALYLCCYA